MYGDSEFIPQSPQQTIISMTHVCIIQNSAKHSHLSVQKKPNPLFHDNVHGYATRPDRRGKSVG